MVGGGGGVVHAPFLRAPPQEELPAARGQAEGCTSCGVCVKSEEGWSLQARSNEKVYLHGFKLAGKELVALCFLHLGAGEFGLHFLVALAHRCLERLK